MASWTIRADYDPEGRVWYVSDSDIPGLAIDAVTFEELAAKAGRHLPDLIDIHSDDLAPAQKRGPHRVRIVAHHEHQFDIAA